MPPKSAKKRSSRPSPYTPVRSRTSFKEAGLSLEWGTKLGGQLKVAKAIATEEEEDEVVEPREPSTPKFKM